MRPATVLLACLLSVSAARAEAPPEPATAPPATTDQAEPSKVPFQYGFHGFLRAGYFYVPYNKDSSPYVGRDSGFELLNSRLEFAGAYSHWVDFKISIDNYGRLDPTGANASALAPFAPGFTDVYVSGYLGAFYLRLGQFKTPFNGEFLLDDEFVPFARRSLVSTGAAIDRTPYDIPALILDRELGAMVGGKFMFGEKNHLDVDVAAVNGNGINQGLNDNRSPAVVGRASATFSFLTVAAAGYWNARSAGTLATQQDETDMAFDADVLLNFDHLALGGGNSGALKIFGMYAMKQTHFETTPDAKDDSSFGAVGSASFAIDTAQVRYEPAVRVSYYVPTSLIEQAQVLDATIGLNVGPRAIPARAQLNYTVRRHDVSKQVPDDLFEFVLQANF